VILEQAGGKNRPDNSGKAAGTLSEADGRALLMSWSED
jgi:hypothetical protein